MSGFGVLDYTLFSAHNFAVLSLEGCLHITSIGNDLWR